MGRIQQKRPPISTPYKGRKHDESVRLPSADQIIFGRARIAELGAQIPAKTKRVFIVTDETIATRTPALDVTLQALSGRKIRTFTRVEENPSIATVEDGGREARTFKAQLVIGLGGGSPMDAAKGIAMLAANPGPLSRHLGGEPMKRPPFRSSPFRGR